MRAQPLFQRQTKRLPLRGIQRTLVVFPSDHGYYLGDHGYTGKHTVHVPKRGWPLYAEVARVLLFISVPGMTPGRSSALVQAVDVHALLFDLLGLDAPSLHGTSALPLLQGGRDRIRDVALSSPTLPATADAHPGPARRHAAPPVRSVAKGANAMIRAPQAQAREVRRPTASQRMTQSSAR
ncbi:MAG: hypothetical protein M1396_00810 [Chloroflexi bacterium]|nr:hypothetical protein [Chloroflexota bacterium]